MRVAVFSTKPYDRQFFESTNTQQARHELAFLEPRLTLQTCRLAHGFPAVCAFVNDQLDEPVLKELTAGGTRLLALRCAGFNHVDLAAAAKLSLPVVRVPAYSPHAVAEHTVGLILALDRKLHRAHARVREGNFALDGLLGFDLFGRAVGVVGTGKIGSLVARIMSGFGCQILAHDRTPDAQVSALGARYVDLDELFRLSDIVTLHCPLLPATRHMVNERTLGLMKPGGMLINTSRGALVDTRAVIQSLKDRHLGHLGLDVYEEEADLFFEDLSSAVIRDDVFARLQTFPNVLITGHQAFFTSNALESIARQTLDNISEFERGAALTNAVGLERRLS